MPEQLRHAFLADQKFMYSLLMKTVAGAVTDLARNEKRIGATPGILMILHTWTGQMTYHHLARYAFRIAITNARIVAMDDTHVTFRHKDRKANQWRTCRLTGVEFLRRLLVIGSP